MQDERIVAFVDKTVMRITGLSVKGLNTEQLENILIEKFGSVVRVIGVTGSHVEMDVYGIEPEYIKKNEQDVIEAVALAEGITLTELAQVEHAEKIMEVDYRTLDVPDEHYCPREQWRRPE